MLLRMTIEEGERSPTRTGIQAVPSGREGARTPYAAQTGRWRDHEFLVIDEKWAHPWEDLLDGRKCRIGMEKG